MASSQAAGAIKFRRTLRLFFLKTALTDALSSMRLSISFIEVWDRSCFIITLIPSGEVASTSIVSSNTCASLFMPNILDVAFPMLVDVYALVWEGEVESALRLWLGLQTDIGR
ncbi:hypothetical protein CSPAE12_06151 [Colletotrichum incanum]|nr:hypothetical protein CSPAE12_06151 [Colletotrichum incanum]